MKIPLIDGCCKGQTFDDYLLGSRTAVFCMPVPPKGDIIDFANFNPFELPAEEYYYVHRVFLFGHAVNVASVQSTASYMNAEDLFAALASDKAKAAVCQR